MTSPYIIKENEKIQKFERETYLLDHEFYILSTDYEWLWKKLCETNISFVGWAVTNKNDRLKIIATSMKSVVNDIIIGTIGYTLFSTNHLSDSYTLFSTNHLSDKDWFILTCQVYSLHYVIGVKQ